MSVISYRAALLPLNHLVTATLKKIVPSTTKRMIVLVSILAFIKNTHEPDEIILIRLRYAFGFQQTYDSYQLPWRISKFIWKPLINDRILLQDEIFKTTRESDTTTIVNKFLTRMPNWLMYDRREIIKRDIIQLLTLC